MTDSHKRRGAKRARKPHQANADAHDLFSAIRKALSKHPVHLLSFASHLVSRCATEDDWSMEGLIANLARIRRRETTALLAVLAELLDDELLRDRCHQEVATRHHYLPKWIVGLGAVEIRRVMRRTEALGDGDKLAIGLRLAGGTELTLAAFLDHNYLSAVTDLTVLPQSVDRAITQGVAAPTTFVDMEPADARAWMERGILWGGCILHPEWREGLPLVTWLLAQLPGGGSVYERPEWDNEAIAALLDEFAASPAGAPFADARYRDLLSELCDAGCGDPLRWSVHRVSSILRDPHREEYIPLEVALDAPALLRAFIPFAHAHSRIRPGLTDAAIRTIDEMSLQYKRALLDEASESYGFDDDPWANRAS